ncbi:helix-turn-helix domain-containing protein [Spongiactinospora sp. TRM90649]|uniref:helix-turn-helix domain-containing protein n=1 Tax=Spongiactinospora sp. TRM90649 TaxID=3031114 RepID=UPI0023F8FDE1|nr:helix-turn-helix domain-containing protein [Spongiactinospora sp. TRM90649]MDF5759193.1 helix-turn-helix domain-containing protein [Spongiactinospora sp. TRM90649]
MSSAERLLTPEEVGRIYKVEPVTVSRWARAGRIRSTKTPGGHWRVYASDVEAHMSHPVDLAIAEAGAA